MGGSAVLIHLESNRVFELNSTGARIWTMIESGLDHDEICSRLQKEFGQPAAEIQASVDELLTSLQRENLIRA